MAAISSLISTFMVIRHRYFEKLRKTCWYYCSDMERNVCYGCPQLLRIMYIMLNCYMNIFIFKSPQSSPFLKYKYKNTKLYKSAHWDWVTIYSAQNLLTLALWKHLVRMYASPEYLFVSEHQKKHLKFSYITDGRWAYIGYNCSKCFTLLLIGIRIAAIRYSYRKLNDVKRNSLMP